MCIAGGGNLRRGIGTGAIALVLLSSGCGLRAPAHATHVPHPMPILATGTGPGALAATGTVAHIAPPPDPRHALLIGINHAAGHSTLHGAVGDATTLRDALVGYGFPAGNVTMLLDGAATRPAILSAIATLASQTPAGGRAVFAFAGHTKKVNGENVLDTAEGRTISAHELARAMSAVRAPMWAAFPTCYSAGFRVPGITGPDRVVTFSSLADGLSFENTAFHRSYLFQFMVEEAMILGRAPAPSVESAFDYASDAMRREEPEDSPPAIDDQYPGDFVLAGQSWHTPRVSVDAAAPPPQPASPHTSDAQPPHPPPADEPAVQPAAESGPRACGGLLTLGSDCGS